MSAAAAAHSGRRRRGGHPRDDDLHLPGRLRGAHLDRRRARRSSCSTRSAPFAVVLTDQRMPDMSGVEFVAEVFRRHPATVRMILTGFSDIDAIIQAINDGHVYAYITKPWEPEQLKQLMKQAVEHYKLTVENERLLADLRKRQRVPRRGDGRARHRRHRARRRRRHPGDQPPGARVPGLGDEVRGRPLRRPALAARGIDAVEARYARPSARRASPTATSTSSSHRFRVTRAQPAPTTRASGSAAWCCSARSRTSRCSAASTSCSATSCPSAARCGRCSRPRCDKLRAARRGDPRARRCSPLGMSELAERVSRTRTALDNWLEVDDAMAREDFPDAHLLQDRMRIVVRALAAPRRAAGARARARPARRGLLRVRREAGPAGALRPVAGAARRRSTASSCGSSGCTSRSASPTRSTRARCASSAIAARLRARVPRDLLVPRLPPRSRRAVPPAPGSGDAPAAAGARRRASATPQLLASRLVLAAAALPRARARPPRGATRASARRALLRV